MINYFELYGLQISFHPDQEKVKKKFYELSRQFHPDRFAMGGSDAMDEALRMSAMNNEAYKTLKDADATMKFILKYNNVLEEEEKYDLPPNFLMEMMELNEAVSEYELEPENEDMKQLAVGNWQSQLEQLETEVEKLTRKFDEGEENKEILLRIKDYYFRKKYILRVQERINTFATR